MDTLTIKQPIHRHILSTHVVTGVTEQKKAELDALTIKVLDAQQNEAQYQAIVDSLTE